MNKSLKKTYAKDGQDRLLSRLSLFAFDRPRFIALVWLVIAAMGVLSYTTFMKREGFPSVAIPYSVATGAYLVNDAQKVDANVAKPVSDIILKDSRVQSVQAQSRSNFYSVAVQYKEGTDANVAGKDIQKAIDTAHVLPKQATLKIESPKFGFTERGDDIVISVYAKKAGTSTAQLTAEAQKVVTYLKDQHVADIKSVSVVDPYVTGTDPLTGKQGTSQTLFDRFGERQNGQSAFYNSVSVGIVQRSGTDVIKLDEQLQDLLNKYNAQHANSSVTTKVSASYAEDIKHQIGELQRSLFEGLIAVLIVGSIVIAVRASLITVVTMLTVLATTIGILFLAGYTLNTITLFALILCLGLIVDDTIIMIEAIDAQRRRSKDPRDTVKVATRKVSRAMVAATSTAALSFAPLLFVSGILGSFIRAIPITVITSLLVSLCVALVFIPFFAKYLLLGKKQMGEKNVREVAAGFETSVANFILKPMLWARHSGKKLLGVGLGAVLVGALFMGLSGYLFKKVTFNIFPPSKDSNGLIVKLDFAQGTTLAQAEKVTDKADTVMSQILGDNFVKGAYYSNANQQTATAQVAITPYEKRDVRAPELQKQLETAFKDFNGANVSVSQQDVGPPASAFTVRVQTTDRKAGEKLAADVESYLKHLTLTRASGEKAHVTTSAVSSLDTYLRADGKSYIEVTANFDGTDTTTLVTLAKKAVQDEFTANKLATYNLKADALNFNFGQEDENQKSFASLALAFPILLFVIYLLLAVQFRSLAQPLLIFLAIPFSLLGVTFGLFITDNAFSFFAMLGFFALIGLSIKNTILLTDYANQLRRKGEPVVDAVVGALSERFRPLIATSFTAVVSLIPLAIASPFWEGLAVVLIFGLLSSTFLVIIVFPYYYLGAEWLRMRVSRKAGLITLAIIVASFVLISRAGAL
ncbi:MAG TPA: efflux RND transporter permease subunit [Candidatus Saccharimonadales bacterium]|nr:efflux RND transporter permease subunit [Candidatus Saccharimonadales bacterium]